MQKFFPILVILVAWSFISTAARAQTQAEDYGTPEDGTGGGISPMTSPFWKPTFSYQGKKGIRPSGMLFDTGDPIIDFAERYYFIYFGDLPLLVMGERDSQEFVDVSVLLVTLMKNERQLRYLCDSRIRILAFLNRISQRTPIKRTTRELDLRQMQVDLSNALIERLDNKDYFSELDIVEGKYFLKNSKYVGVKRNIWRENVKTCDNYDKERRELVKKNQTEDQINSAEKRATTQEIRQRFRTFRRSF